MSNQKPPLAHTRLLALFCAALASLVSLDAPRAVRAQTEPPPVAAPAPAPAPARTADIFQGPGSRMPLLGEETPKLGQTPRPDEETLKKYRHFVDSLVDPDNTLELVVGRPRLVVLKQTPLRVQIPNEDIAAYTLLSASELSVTGVHVGTTLLNIWVKDPASPKGQSVLSYLVRVIPDPEAKGRLERIYKALEAEVNKAFPNSGVSLTLVGDSLVVRGQAVDSKEAGQIVSVVASNAPSPTAANNPVGYLDDTRQIDAGGSLIPGIRDYTFRYDTDAAGMVLQSRRGSAAGTNNNNNNNTAQITLPGGGKIINLIRVPGEPQVMLRVTVAEVNRSAARSIGLNFTMNNGPRQNPNAIANLAGNLTGSAANLPMIFDNGQVAIQLQALRGLNLSKSLAEPNLVTLNGQSATFSSGGQFPVPVVTGATSTGLQGVDFVNFGVTLTFTPFIKDRDRIRLVLAAEVSSRAPEIGTSIGSSDVSGKNTSNVETVVELRAGQTLAVAGLIQRSYSNNKNRVPGAGDLPWIGWLFGTSTNNADERELIVLVNAELVYPLDSKEVAPLPGHDVFEPDDLEFYLLGRMESQRKDKDGNPRQDWRSPARNDWDKLFANTPEEAAAERAEKERAEAAKADQESKEAAPAPESNPDQAPAPTTQGPLSKSATIEERQRYQKAEQTYIIGPSGYSDSHSK
jgi:pilus assembly protein CpaC